MPNNSLVAAAATGTAGIGAGLVDNFEGLYQSVHSGSWVDGLLAGGSFAVDVAASALDPFSALLSNGLGWAMEHFAPLRDMLDKLTGSPDRVQGHAATWNNMAGKLDAMAQDLQANLGADLPDWIGNASESYRAMMANNVDALGGSAVLASIMSSATQAAGNLVAFTRGIVRDLIADLVARVIVWAAEAIFVVTIPVVTEQIVVAVVKWLARITGYVSALLTSLTNLKTLLGD